MDDMVNELADNCNNSNRGQSSSPARKRKRTNSSSDEEDDESDQEAIDLIEEELELNSNKFCMRPVNFSMDEVRAVLGEKRGRPCNMNLKVKDLDTFDDVGGLDHIVEAVKDMIMLPMTRPDSYKQYNVKPVRGIIFFGPPGVGKTMIARAVVNACGKDFGRKIAFFVRNASDVMDPYIGQSEANLRKTFMLASLLSPSIIFFDEIDALAPVRSMKEDNRVASSVVSVLLTLMDGLSDRGEVFVIGATNRLDIIDPAVRRPGRFDNEFYFPMPNLIARRDILDKKTDSWNLDPTLLDYLAKKTWSYSGADLGLLCTQAMVNAMKRSMGRSVGATRRSPRNPIVIGQEDFDSALHSVKPTKTRIGDVVVKPLDDELVPLFGQIVGDIQCKLNELLPVEVTNNQDFRIVPEFRRFLLRVDEFQTEQLHVILKAVLYSYEGVAMFELSLLRMSATINPMESIACFFDAVKRIRLAIVIIPDICKLNLHTDPCAQYLLDELQNIDASTPILIFAIASSSDVGICKKLKKHGFVESILRSPNDQERHAFFENLFESSRPSERRGNRVLGHLSDSEVNGLVDLALENCGPNFPDIQKRYAKITTILRDANFTSVSTLHDLIRGQ